MLLREVEVEVEVDFEVEVGGPDAEVRNAFELDRTPDLVARRRDGYPSG